MPQYLRTSFSRPSIIACLNAFSISAGVVGSGSGGFAGLVSGGGGAGLLSVGGVGEGAGLGWLSPLLPQATISKMHATRSMRAMIRRHRATVATDGRPDGHAQ